jgi:hypothetical protein
MAASYGCRNRPATAGAIKAYPPFQSVSASGGDQRSVVLVRVTGSRVYSTATLIVT